MLNSSTSLKKKKKQKNKEWFMTLEIDQKKIKWYNFIVEEERN